MNVKADTNEFRFDGIKWLLAIVIIIAGVAGNSHYSDYSLLYRVLGLLLLGLASLGVIAQTAKGSAFLAMAKEARTEIRKVVWPTRQETIQTTFIVIVAILIMALVLWGIDSLISWIVSGVIS